MQGPISIQVFAIPTSGRVKSSSVRPTARSIARAGARLAPSVRAPLRHFSGWVDIGLGFSAPAPHVRVRVDERLLSCTLLDK